jgi:selenocysteine lyase/cysteine desulfurase
VRLVGDGIPVPCVDGLERPYLSCDAAASTAPLPAVLSAVEEFLPWYSSVHRGAGYKSQRSTDAYEAARESVLNFAGRNRRDDIAVICRNTTEAVNHLAYRLRLTKQDVVVTTVVEHHANLLPWARVARCRYVECEKDGTIGMAALTEALDEKPAPKLLTITGASNVTGWMPFIAGIVAEAHQRGVPVMVDAAQLAPHRRLPDGPDFLALSLDPAPREGRSGIAQRGGGGGAGGCCRTLNANRMAGHSRPRQSTFVSAAPGAGCHPRRPSSRPRP